ncbi:MAG TPA: DUF5908 family protein [Malonomonas sp.]
MPVQINEIVIRAVVEADSTQQPEADPQQQREEIVNECVEQVLEILRNRQER